MLINQALSTKCCIFHIILLLYFLTKANLFLGRVYMNQLQGNMLDFDTMVTVVVENLPSYLQDYFQKNIRYNEQLLSAICHEMGEWSQYEHLDLSDISFVARYILETSLSLSSDINGHIKRYSNLRRYQKRYWFDTVKKELGVEGKKASPRNKTFISDECDRYFMLKKTNNIEDTYKNREDFIWHRYREIEQWAQEPTSPLCRYVYIRLLNDTSQAKAFIIDMGYEIFTYIKNEQYGNPLGFRTSLPTDVFKAPFFGFRQERLVLDTESDEQVINVIDKYAYKDTTVDTIVRTFNIGEQTSISEAEDLAQKEVAVNYRSLDTNDLQLLTLICSNITADTINDDVVEISLNQICHQFYRKENVRTKARKEVLNHIERLAKYTLQAEQYADGMYEKLVLHFFDVHYRIPAEKNSGERDIDQEMADFLSESELGKSLDFDLSKAVIQFSLGKTIKDAWKEEKMSQIYSKLYHLIDVQEPKAKTMLFILENERMKIYPELELKSLPYKFFTDKLRFSNMPPNKIKAEIDKILQLIKEQGILIDNYSMGALSIDLEFLPFSKTEKLVYRISDKE